MKCEGATKLYGQLSYINCCKLIFYLIRWYRIVESKHN